jgi:flagellar assembly protein FliH
MNGTDDDSRVWHNLSNAKAWSVPEFDNGGVTEAEETIKGPPTAAQLDALQKQAFDEAHAQGFAAGMAAGQVALDAAIERLSIIAAELAAPLNELDRDLEYSLSNLALILARRIVGKAVRDDAESLHSLVTQVVAVLGHAVESQVDVYLCPQDLLFLDESVGDLASWNLHADTTLQSGDVRVKRGLAEVDGRLQQRLDRLAAEMLNA